MISVFMRLAHNAAERQGQPNRRDAARLEASRSPYPTDSAAARDAQSRGGVAIPADEPSSHVFVCCKHSDVRARGILAQVSAALGQAHHIFFDQADVVDPGWATRLASALNRSGTVVAFMSNQSIDSEMVEAELAMARDLAATEPAMSNLLVLRLPTSGAPPYPLRRYLEGVDEIVFAGDIRALADNLHRAVAGDSADAAGPRLAAPAAQQQPAASAPPRPLPWADPEPPEGVTEPQSAFYVERSADAEALRAIREQGVTVTIKGARQVGKTSLLSRVAAEARRHGKRALVLDFQLFERRLLGDTDRLFRYFCEAVTIGLGVESRVDAFWGNMGNSYHCTRYLERYLLPQLDAPLVLAIDKVDRLPHAATRSDFFGMLRTWCQNRATTPVWKRLDLVLVTSTEPHRLVDNPYQSPFNIGLTVALDDFTPAQVADLNQRHGLPFAPAQLEALTGLLGGHPYLIRRALYLATAGRLAPEELIARAHDDGGPFGDHLRYQLFKLGGQPKLIVELRRILSRGAHTDEQAFYELHSAGLVRREGERSAPRCQLYGAYLRERLA